MPRPAWDSQFRETFDERRKRLRASYAKRKALACNVCEGRGMVNARDDVLTCGHCNGTGVPVSENVKG